MFFILKYLEENHIYLQEKREKKVVILAYILLEMLSCLLTSRVSLVLLVLLALLVVLVTG